MNEATADSTGAPLAAAVPETLRRVAASRLYQGPRTKRLAAADRLIAAASQHNIRPDLMWATFGESAAIEPVRQLVMGVPGSGRTAMLFLSPPGPVGACGDARAQQSELAACVRAARAGLHPAHARLIQALPEPHETWSIEACVEGGLTLIGELAYMRRPFSPNDGDEIEPWPSGVDVRPLGKGADTDFEALETALASSYIETLDCPELCGLRDTSDVVASHVATGLFDPSTWWMVWHEGQPEGCVLMSHCPEHDSVELVYLGLSPKIRGRGLGEALLRGSIARCKAYNAASVTLAVDRRNAPALRLYDRLGFRAFASRVALVWGPTPPAS
ncbi:MAG: GNAT family N-acetyltransferase [Planctomycetota bacterium]